MSRPSVYFTITFILTLFFLSSLAVFNFILLLILSAITCLVLLFSKIAQPKQVVLIALAILLAGGVFSHEDYNKNKILKYAGNNNIFSGKIIDISDYDGGNSSYILKGKFDNKQKATVTLYNDSLPCEYGDVLVISGIFEKPENNYLFNTKNYLEGKNIYLQSNQPEDIEIIYQNNKTLNFIRTLQNYRKKISQKINIVLGTDNGGIMNAMLVGDKTELDNNTKDLFYRTGIGHVMAVSGLHLVFMISFLVWLLKKLHLNNKYSVFLVSVIAVVIFSICVNSPVSVIRAGIMCIIQKNSRIVRRENDSLNSLGICEFFMLLFSPYLAKNAGFLLSLAGTYGVSVFSPWMTDKIKINNKNKIYIKPVKSFLGGLCITLCIFPVSAVYFDEISILSPLTNIFIIPLCMTVIFLGFIIFFTGGSFFIINILSYIINPLIKLIKYLTAICGKSNFSYVTVNNEIVLPVCLIFLYLICILYFIFKDRRLTAVMLCAAILTSEIGTTIFKTSKNQVKIFVGGDKNECVLLINSGTQNYIIDLTGGRNNSKYINKYLESNGISKISSLIITEKIPSAISSYNKNLSLITPSSLILPSDTEKYTNYYTICNSSPHYFENKINIGSGKLDINIIKNKTYSVKIKYGNATYLFTKNPNESGADVIFIYGRHKKVYNNSYTIYLSEQQIKPTVPHDSNKILTNPENISIPTPTKITLLESREFKLQ